MSVVKRGKVYHLRIRPFGPELITVRTPAMTKSEAINIERAILIACKSGDYRSLDPKSRSVCMTMFRNRRLEIPLDLAGSAPTKEELTLWQGIDFFLNYSTVKASPTKERYIYCLNHLVRKFGKLRSLKSLWVPDLRLYQAERQAEKASPATINWEIATLSRLFGVMIELQLVETNPVRLIKRLSVKSAQREAYLGFQTVQEITNRCPAWCGPIIKTAYYTGMRRGEILGLTWKQVNLASRIIVLGPEETKERNWKRVPINRDLVSVFEEAMKVRAIGTDKVFLIDGRPPSHESMKNPWRKAVKVMGLESRPRFHDLRHTWKANARRSGMDPEIRESIMGHWFREKSVSERYGRISDRELVQAIDLMTFDHGETQIWANR
jgi:integrase